MNSLETRECGFLSVEPDGVWTELRTFHGGLRPRKLPRWVVRACNGQRSRRPSRETATLEHAL